MIRPFFHTCSVENVKYRSNVVTNKPVNLNHCISIEKVKFNWYPDNEGLPAIKFHGCGQEWVYPTVKERDADFLFISQNNFDN